MRLLSDSIEQERTQQLYWHILLLVLFAGTLLASYALRRAEHTKEERAKADGRQQQQS